MRKRLLGPAMVAVLVMMSLGVASGTAGAANGGRPFNIVLSGANEFDAAGVAINPHGNADRGTIKLRLNAGRERVCWTVGALTLTAGDPLPSAAHIHEAPAGVAGPVVIPLFGGPEAPAPTSYPTGEVCVSADRAEIKAIFKDPSDYYVNFHSALHPGGVMRGQLG
jgi:hypothetical protein